jgi:hypothetical protein
MLSEIYGIIRLRVRKKDRLVAWNCVRVIKGVSQKLNMQ